MPELTIVQAVNLALDEEMARDDRVTLLGEDIGVNGGVFRATQGLHDKYGEKRVLDTPLNESGIIGFGIGMALYGLLPVVEV
ncbi:MAG: alpha-ketoacid dehydrogenase subunit beta, partial [Candidatus Hodarchaeales archaeon]